MKKRVNKYIGDVKAAIADGGDTEAIRADLLVWIGFFQHERLIHLIVTVLFALLELFSLFFTCITLSIPGLILAVLFLSLLIPYIMHYYFLENSVQEMYDIYRSITK